MQVRYFVYAFFGLIIHLIYIYLYVRTLFIWMVSIYLGWEQFSWIQVIGFIVMVTGTFYFNGVLKWPFVTEEVEESERAPLLNHEE